MSRRLENCFLDLAPPVLQFDRLDDGSEGVIEVAALVIPMSRVLFGADLDCEVADSSQSPDTRITRSVDYYFVSWRAVIVESSLDGN